MYVRDPGQPTEPPDPIFDSVQLDLPLPASFEEVLGDESVSLQWRSPHKVLTEYLKAIGVSYPEAVARVLLGEFGSLADLLAGSTWRVRQVVGKRVAAAIKASRELMKVALSERLPERPLVPGSRQLADFLRAEIGYLPHERLLAIYVDHRRHLLRIEKIADGSLVGAAVDFRRIVWGGLRSGAEGILLVHNHPSGNPAPSNADLQVTARLRSTIEHLDMYLLDHLIIARDQVASIEHFWRENRWAQEA